MGKIFDRENINMVDLYQLLFVALKLCGVINWPWWAVFLPLLSVLALSTAAGVVAALAAKKNRGDGPEA